MNHKICTISFDQYETINAAFRIAQAEAHGRAIEAGDTLTQGLYLTSLAAIRDMRANLEAVYGNGASDAAVIVTATAIDNGVDEYEEPDTEYMNICMGDERSIAWQTVFTVRQLCDTAMTADDPQDRADIFAALRRLLD